MKYLIILICLLLAADEPRVTVEQLFSVQTIKVTNITASKIQKNYGYVQVDDSKVYSVTPRFGGYVEVLYADTIYKYVKKGELLAKVYSPEVLSAKEEYLASLNYSKGRSNPDMVESSREKLLLLNVTQEEINNIQNSLKASKFTNIYAPASGFVFKKYISNLDAFNAKQKLFEIVNLDSVWVEVKVHQKELPNLKTLEKFKVKAAGVDEIFEAKKDILYPNIDDKEATLTLRLNVKNRDHLLKSGMYVSVGGSAKEKGVLTLPTTSVMRKNGLFYVFMVGEYEGEYEPVEVDVKVLNASTYIVENGVSEGDEVVKNALFMMDSDAQINGLY